MRAKIQSSISTILAALGCTAVFVAQLLKMRTDPILFALEDQYTGDTSDLFGGYYEVGPPSLTITDFRIYVLVLVVAVIFSVAAIVVGYRRIRMGDSGHYAAAGTVGGLLGLLWLAKLVVLGV